MARYATVFETLKRAVVGTPIATSEEHTTRLPKRIALPVFASDAISSTAYATQEILIVLIPAVGVAATSRLVPIAVVVCLLLVVVVASYRQTIHAYPHGGGTYIVSKDNLGEMPALVAGASILVDYVLTVAVSVTAGIAAIISAFPGLQDARVLLCLLAVLLMTVANLRGLKESGTLFAFPTYTYVTILFVLIVTGLVRSYSGDIDPLPPDHEAIDELTGGAALTGFSLLIMLRAFASGAVALTGVEAIADGVPAFRRPEARNASTTLVMMATILGSAFFGISLLSARLDPTPTEHDTLLSILGTAVFGDGSVLYYILQFSTFAILILAANTAYADFPRLSSIIARDEFLPHQFRNRGDRLVFSNGIIVLALLASALIVAFGGVTTALIPLYAVGVFTGFTLSQAGMVVRHRRLREPGWRGRMAISLIGTCATSVVLLVVLVSKFTVGAWLPAVVIPLIVLLFQSIGRHYRRVRRAIDVPVGWRPKRRTHTVTVLVGSVNMGTLEAVSYARSLAPDRLVCVSVVTDDEEQNRLADAWVAHEVPAELTFLHSPYRALTRPVLRFLDELDAEDADDRITVVIPEFVVSRWYTQVLHNQTALALKARLLFRPHTVVTSVPVHVD